MERETPGPPFRPEPTPLDVGTGIQAQPAARRFAVLEPHGISLPLDRPYAVDPAVKYLTHYETSSRNHGSSPGSLRLVIDLPQPLGVDTGFCLNVDSMDRMCYSGLAAPAFTWPQERA